MRSGWAWRGITVTVLCLGAGGCRHRVAPATLPTAAQGPVPLEKTPEPKTPPLVQTVPLQPTPLPAVTVPVKKVRKPRKKTAPIGVASGTTSGSGAAAAPPAPGSEAGAPLAPASQDGAVASQANVVGALTAGGEATTENHQKAAELIAGLEKRLAGLSPAVAEKQKEAVTRVKLFERQAQAALSSGDADGAVTLATKANLLLDDLEK